MSAFPAAVFALDLSDEMLEKIRALNHVYETDYSDSRLEVRFSGGKHNLIHVLNLLQENNVSFSRAYSELPTLNDVFLEITGKALRDKE